MTTFEDISRKRHGPLLPGSHNFISQLPKTRYFGSKRRHVSWLLDQFKAHNNGLVVDYFGGTGTTALLFSYLGNRVIFNDIFEFNRIMARAIFSDAERKMSTREVKSFCSSVTPFKGFVSEEFKGLYYTDEENMWLDGALQKIGRMRCEDKKNAILYCLFQACLSKRPFNLFHRANLNLRINHQGSKFGNKTTWEKSFEEHMLTAFLELEKAWSGGGGGVRVASGSSEVESYRGKISVLYLDPPYIRSDRYSEPYSLRYHFLEGMARPKEWPQMIDRSSKTKSFLAEKFRNEWRRRSDVIQGIGNLVETLKPKTVCISYAERSDPSIDQISSIIRDLGGKDSVSSMPYKSALSNKPRAEFLVTGDFS